MSFNCCKHCDEPDSFHGDDRREGHVASCLDGCNDAQVTQP